ncbi:MAG: EthD domain-containing protein [Terrimesophilobacter sp.]
MTAVDRSGDTDAAVALRRRALLVFTDEVDIAEFASYVAASVKSHEFGDLAVKAFQSTRGYRADPNRPQEFHDIAAAVQFDYGPDVEPDLLRLLHDLDFPTPLGEATISVGAVVTLLEPLGSNLLLLGAQRRTDMTAEQFGEYWSQKHAPHAVKELREAPVPIGYELFLVDHSLSDSGATEQWRPSEIDGWMHITTRGPSDFEKVARDPAHRSWVLEDEVNFVNFEAPMVGQQMLLVPQSTKVHITSKKERQSCETNDSSRAPLRS